ncbi:MAG: homocysteine methyltransferase [Planctomycetes bacterium]|nr:homocysteine methyltransferase [Planctomycetota bacterium]
MTPDELKAAVRTRPRLVDGAMGTQLMARGLPSGACGELWNVEHPDRVAAIHRDYCQAGCDWIITNTFGGSSASLERHGLADRAAELNRAAARLAREALDDHVVVLGDIGPFGGFLEPYGEMAPERLLEVFSEQAAALAEGGADAFIIETMADTRELQIAVQAARQAGNKAVIATYAFDKSADGSLRTMMGTTVDEAIATAIEAGADMVGANCGTSLSLDDYVQLAEQLVAAAGQTPVILEPNAGAPQNVDGQLVYPATPEAMAEIVPRLLAAGVRAIGGCCGTTPDHLRAMRDALDRYISALEPS